MFLIDFEEKDRFQSLEWIKKNKIEIDNKLTLHGAILLKNINVSSSTMFEEIVRIFAKKLYNKNGEHEAFNRSGTVQTPVSYPKDMNLEPHCENTFHFSFPSKIYFSCQIAALEGGATTVYDTRKYFQLLPNKIKERFMEKKVMYVRCYIDGFGLSYGKTLGVSTKKEAENYCHLNALSYEWLGNILKTRAIRPAAISHPESGEICFISQINHWHQSRLEPEVRKSLRENYDVELMPRDLLYGDGSIIEDSIIQEMSEIYKQIEVSNKWQKGDFMLIDNILSAHGRQKYTGEREILVSLSDPINFKSSLCLPNKPFEPVNSVGKITI
ncbi:TauD/TfdA family dioxygenase [Rheinheimera baltica]|uniref:TauD/TfdA family dioxygenase n=1 Tax=Rheinheimera baltica TaxID=67576 RepID=A0ABT9I3K8_9GAMM|nr:TauD/TfdA family dioxygenase [Rheinheimera baltica]MDP5137954.1 TauD/TfdA family dioxygenase [Rheinheimera baltica]